MTSLSRLLRWDENARIPTGRVLPASEHELSLSLSLPLPRSSSLSASSVSKVSKEVATDKAMNSITLFSVDFSVDACDFA